MAKLLKLIMTLTMKDNPIEEAIAVEKKIFDLYGSLIEAIKTAKARALVRRRLYIRLRRAVAEKNKKEVAILRDEIRRHPALKINL